MKISYDILEQLRTGRMAILFVAVVSSALMGIMIFFHFLLGVPISELTRDPISILGGSIYQGFLSQIGIFFWAASAAVCFFGAFVLEKSSNTVKLKNFLLVSGAMSLFLGLDDVFLLHEELFPYLGVNQKLVLLSYGLFVLWWVLNFHTIILQTESILLGIACMFFGCSVVIDVINPDIRSPQFYEDGAKIAGLVSWLIYFFRFTAFAVRVDGRFAERECVIKFQKKV